MSWSVCVSATRRHAPSWPGRHLFSTWLRPAIDYRYHTRSSGAIQEFYWCVSPHMVYSRSYFLDERYWQACGWFLCYRYPSLPHAALLRKCRRSLPLDASTPTPTSHDVTYRLLSISGDAIYWTTSHEISRDTTISMRCSILATFLPYPCRGVRSPFLDAGIACSASMRAPAPYWA